MNINLDVLCSLASISSMFSVSVPSAARAPRVECLVYHFTIGYGADGYVN